MLKNFNKNKFFYLLILISFSLLQSKDQPSLLLKTTKNIVIYTDSPKTEKLGYGEWDVATDGEYLVIKTFIKEGDVLIDAGAHVGDWSELAFNHTQGKSSIYAFEPVPTFFKKLTNRLPQVHCFNVALGATEKEAVMNYYYEESEGCSSLFERKVLASIPVKKITVPVISLDTFCNAKSIDHIDFLKIDVEGAEWDVLQGANNLIKNKKIEAIQFEYGGTFPDAHITLFQVYTYLNSNGYSIFRITPNGLIHIAEWRSELENYNLSNYLALLNGKHWTLLNLY